MIWPTYRINDLNQASTSRKARSAKFISIKLLQAAKI